MSHGVTSILKNRRNYPLVLLFSHLHGDKLVALLLKAGNDFPNEIALHTIRLDHNVSALHSAFTTSHTIRMRAALSSFR